MIISLYPFFFAVALFLAQSRCCSGFVATTGREICKAISHRSYRIILGVSLERKQSSCNVQQDHSAIFLQSRRLAGCVTLASLGGVCLPLTAIAKTAVSSSTSDRQKLYKGYQRLNYLLAHWEEETTVCGKNIDDNPYLTGGKCERTPLRVMDYLGYKNTEDPLFRADRTMQRLESEVPAGRESEYLEAIEQWIEAADEGSGMAYISSWGEANPGGGKDRVQLFIERAKKNVMDAQQSLATVIDILEISKEAS